MLVKKILTLLSLLTIASFFLLLTPNIVSAKCNGPNGKTGLCYAQKTCSGTSSALCCDTDAECAAAVTNPTYIDCTERSEQCLAVQPIGCSKSGKSYCCGASSDCTLLGGTVNTKTSHTWPINQSGVICTPQGGTLDSGINTAIGCIPVLNNDNGTTFMAFILRWAVGVGGGIAFLLILYAGFMIMTSAGNPERLKAGQELLTSAISGLILLIFSVFILKFIGIDILGLGAFGFGK
jgi:hypothetical protein